MPLASATLEALVHNSLEFAAPADYADDRAAARRVETKSSTRLQCERMRQFPALRLCFELGLSPARLQTVNPKLVLLHFDAYGGPRERRGDRAAHVSYDDNLQAALGIMAYFGGSVATPEEHMHVGTIDVSAGFAGAFACGLALRERDARRAAGFDDRVLVARTSLAAAGQLLVLPWLGLGDERRDDATPFERPLGGGGPDCRGEHAAYRAYEARDGNWVFVAAAGPLAREPARRAALKKLAMALGGAPVDAADSRDPAGAAAAAVAAEVRGFDAGDVVKVLRSHGVAATLCRSLRALPEDATTHSAPTRKKGDPSPPGVKRRSSLPSAQTYIFADDGATHGVKLFAPCGLRSHLGGGVVPTPPAPKPGKHTVAVLADAGVDAHALVAAGVAATQWSEARFP